MDGPGTPEAPLLVRIIPASGQSNTRLLARREPIIAFLYNSFFVNLPCFVDCLLPAYFNISAFLLIFKSNDVYCPLKYGLLSSPKMVLLGGGNENKNCFFLCVTNVHKATSGSAIVYYIITYIIL